MKNYRKRILSIAIAATLSMCALPQSSPVQIRPSLTASAEGETTTDGFTYEVTADDTVIIKKYIGSSTELVIPDEIDGKPVTEIAALAFMHGYNDSIDKCFTSVKLPKALKTIGNDAFSGQKKLTEITLPETLTSLGTGTFSSCALTEIKIPSGVTEIGEQAFESCDSLSSVDIPESVNSIGANAFRYTKWLSNKQTENPLVVVNGILIDGRACEGDVIVSDIVTSIAGQAFSQNISELSKITSISIPDSVTSIGSDAFYNCAKLEKVKMSNNVTDIGSSTFAGCTQLKEVTLPNSLKTIGYLAFRECSSLISLDIPNGTETINSQAFVLCSNLEAVKIPVSVTRILPAAFYGCPKLTIYGYSDSAAQRFANQFVLPFEELENTGSSFSSASLTLEDDLGLNFYIDGIKNDTDAAEYKVQFSGNCDEAGKAVNIVNKNGKYCATANIQASNMNEVITAKLIKGDKTADVCLYSADRYLNSVDTSKSTELAALVNATKEYGAVSNAYFNDPDNMPEVEDHSDEYYTDTYKPAKKATDKISLVLDSKLAVRLYIHGLAKGVTATCGGKTLYSKKSGNGWYFEVTGIEPKKLASDIIIDYSGYEYTFKPLSWAYLVKKNKATGKNKAMADVLYEYYTCAVAYNKTLNS